MQAELKRAEHKAVASSVTLASRQALAKRNARLLWGEEAQFTGILVKKDQGTFAQHIKVQL